MKKQQNMSSRALEINISSEGLKTSRDILNTILADEFVIYVQTLNYHWNLVGPQFHDYHLLFDKQYHEILDIIDQVAERVRAVGGIALGSMIDYINNATIQEDTGDIPSPQNMILKLLKNHEALIRNIREGVNKTAENNSDMGTNNFLAELMEKHEKHAWMLRSLTEKELV